jgi:hypothetical protein
LPTSLTYIVLSTRGCSPWRPAAVMGTTWRENKNPSRRFSRSVWDSPDAVEAPRHATLATLAPDKPISGFPRVKKKRELFPGHHPVCRRSLTLPWKHSTSRFRNLNRIPFRGAVRKIALFQTELPYPLGSTHPCPTAVHTEPFPTSVFKVLI